MNSSDILNLSLALSALIAAGAFSYGIYHTVITLRTFNKVLEDIKDTTQDIQSVKNTIKLGLGSLAGKFLNQAKRR